MAASTRKGPRRGVEMYVAENASVISTNETNQLKAVAGKVSHVLVWSAGSGATVKLYDSASADENQAWEWNTADGVGVYALQLPIQNGIRVVTSHSTTTAKITVVWN